MKRIWMNQESQANGKKLMKIAFIILTQYKTTLNKVLNILILIAYVIFVEIWVWDSDILAFAYLQALTTWYNHHQAILWLYNLILPNL